MPPAAAGTSPTTRQRWPGCLVQVEPTGVVIEGSPQDVATDDVVDAAGHSIVLFAVSARVPAIADALQAAIVSGDVDAVDRLYAHDIVIWHNYDGIERDKAEGLATISAIHEDYREFHAVDVRRDYLADGYVQRTVFQGMTRALRPFRADAMMRVWTDGTRITRIEEYSAPDQHANSGPAPLAPRVADSRRQPC